MEKQFEKSKIIHLEKAIISICILSGLVVIIGWYTGINEVLSIIPKSATMKINTAIVFLLSGIILITDKFYSKNSIFLYIILSIAIITIGLLTLAEHIGWLYLPIDNFFIEDNISTSNPGRMSPASAICSTLIGIGFLAEKLTNGIFKKIGFYALIITAVMAMVAIIAYVLLIPIESKAIFFKSMAIHTSVLFLLIAVLNLLKNTNTEFFRLILGNYTGSKLIRKVLPLAIVFPIIFNYLLILGINKQIVSLEFGLVIFSTFFIPISIIYITYISLRLNRSDIKKAEVENSIRQSNRYLKQFKDGLDQASIVAITDKRGVITEVNESFCKISQYTKDELIGNTHSIVNSGYHDKEFFINMWKTIGSGNIWVDEIQNKAKDGSLYWVLTAIVPFKNEKNEITEYMALRQDITERKKAEELKSDYVKKLEYKNKELEQFAYVASHDLQEPLRTVINFTDLLERKQREHFDEIGLTSLHFIQEATVRMSQLVKSLLDYNRIDKNNKISLVDCNQLINEIKKDLSKNILEVKATIIVNQLPKIYGYETPLRLLFQNLISNSIKFRKLEQNPYIEITARSNHDEYLFTVKDNGIGIPEHQQDKIFEIFKRLHSRDEYEGSGIGLSHCRKIVDLHGGRIWVDSKLGSGSTFNFTIKSNEHEKKNQLHIVN